MPRSRYRFLEDSKSHFLTATVIDWRPIFGEPAVAQIILNSLQFLQDEDRLNLFAYVLMENHLHLIAEADNLPRQIANFKSFTARKIVDLLQRNRPKALNRFERHGDRFLSGRTHQIWYEGSHPKMILNEPMMCQKVDYIHQNPVKRGYVDEAVHWRYSSARNYEGVGGMIKVTTDWG